MLRSIAPACALLSALMISCGAVRVDEAQWRKRVGALPVVEASTVVEDAAFDGPLIAQSSICYRLTRTSKDKTESWQVEFCAPTTSIDVGLPNAKMTVTSKTPPHRFTTVYTVKQYEGEVSITADGAEPEVVDAPLVLGFLDGRLFRATRLLAPYDRETLEEGSPPREVVVSYFESLAVCLTLSRTLSESKALRSLMSQVVQWPSWWSFLTLKIDASFLLMLEEAEAIDTPYGPGFVVPLELTVNGDQAFHAKVTLVEPKGALLMTAGVIDVVGCAPDRPNDVVRIVLEGATLPDFDLSNEKIRKVLVIEPKCGAETTEIDETASVELPD